MKKHKFIKIILIFFIIGVIHSWSLHSRSMSIFTKSIASVPFYLVPLFLFLTLLLLITIHELGHLISFVFSGIKIRAFYIWFFVIIRGFDNKVKIKFRKEQLGFIGGLVVPNLKPIESEENYASFRKKLAKSLITAPIVTIISSFLIVVLTVVVFIVSSNYFLIGLLLYVSFITILFTIISFKSFFISQDNIYGDFIAYKKIKTDDLFYLNLIIQYNGYSTFSKQKTTFMYNKLADYILNSEVKYESFYLNVLNEYLNYINLYDYSINLDVDNKLNKFNPFNRFIKTDDEAILYQIIQYYFNSGKADKSYDLYFTHYKRLQKNIHELNCLEHYLHIKDHGDYIRNYKYEFDGIEKIISPLINIEEVTKLSLIQGKPQIVVCPIDIETEKK